MTDFFKSALGGMFGAAPTTTSQTQSNSTASATLASNSSISNKLFHDSTNTNDFVGTTIMIGNYKLRIKRLLAEGNRE